MLNMIIQYINGVDHLLSEYDIYKTLAFLIHHAIRTLPREAKMPTSIVPDAVFLQAFSCIRRLELYDSFTVLEDLIFTSGIK